MEKILLQLCIFCIFCFEAFEPFDPLFFVTVLKKIMLLDEEDGNWGESKVCV